MLKISLFLAGLVCLTTAARADTVTILIDAGALKNSTGTAAVPMGSLLQFIASPSGNFTAPNASSYVTGDNVLLRSFAMNYNSQITGETLNAVTSLPTGAGTNASTGEKVILRFYPGLTAASPPATPTAGTSYGQVRSDTIEFGSAGGDGSETPWVLPGAGASVDFDYVTQSDGGTYADATAYATGVVLVAAPEPTSLLLVAGGLAPVLLRRRRHHAARR